MGMEFGLSGLPILAADVWGDHQYFSQQRLDGRERRMDRRRVGLSGSRLLVLASCGTEGNK